MINKVRPAQEPVISNLYIQEMRMKFKNACTIMANVLNILPDNRSLIAVKQWILVMRK